MQSIIQDTKECAECGKWGGLELHHCIHGTANRKPADRYGLTVYLCREHHRELHDRNNELDRKFQRLAQEAFEEKIGDRNDFLRIFGKSYL